MLSVIIEHTKKKLWTKAQNGKEPVWIPKFCSLKVFMPPISAYEFQPGRCNKKSFDGLQRVTQEDPMLGNDKKMSKVKFFLTYFY